MNNSRVTVAVLVTLLTMGSATETMANVREYGAMLFAGGVELAGAGDFENALLHFERSTACGVGPNVLWNIASCHLHLGHRDMAVAYFERFMDKVPACQRSPQMIALVRRLAQADPVIRDQGLIRELQTGLGNAADAARRTEAAAPVVEGTEGPEDDSWRQPGWQGREAALSRAGRRLYDEGVRHVERGDYAGALLAFERSFAYRRYRVTVYNIGSCHLNLGDRDLAMAFYRRYAHDLPGLEEEPAIIEIFNAIDSQPPEISDPAVRRALWTRLDRAMREAEERIR